MVGRSTDSRGCMHWYELLQERQRQPGLGQGQGQASDQVRSHVQLWVACGASFVGSPSLAWAAWLQRSGCKYTKGLLPWEMR